MSHSEPPGKRWRLFLIEDSETDALLLEDALAVTSPSGFDMRRARRLDDAERQLQHETFDVILTDLGLPDSQGLETYRRVRNVARGAPVIVFTGLDDEATGLAALKEGAQDYLLKGEHTGRALARAVRYAIDRKSIQEQLLASQRLEAVSRLAGALAHDFNNLLTIVQANLSLIEHAQSVGELGGLVREVRAAAERGAGLTRQLLALGRSQALEIVPVDLADLLKRSSPALARTLRPATLELELEQGLPAVLADAHTLEQALRALAVNARDAMPGGGTWTVRGRFSRVTHETAALLGSEAGPGDFVVVSLSDTGAGLEPALIDKIWEPLATNDDPSGGGLALATVHGMVAQLRGFIRVQSRVGAGTTFELYLPASTRPGERPSPAPASASRRSGKTVLFVDDERAIRAAARRILATGGYRVIEAASGEEALAAFETNGDEVDLVLTDLSMPGGMSGGELARRLRTIAPAMPILFSSGYSEEIVQGRLQLKQGITFLAKPYSAHQLLDFVARAAAVPSRSVRSEEGRLVEPERPG